MVALDVPMVRGVTGYGLGSGVAGSAGAGPRSSRGYLQGFLQLFLAHHQSLGFSGLFVAAIPPGIPCPLADVRPYW